jgi:drug/metabolite transporter (DMT)-like permease
MISAESPHMKLLPDHYTAPYGSPEALENLGTAAAPLLAGFSFALIGLLLDKSDVMWEPNLALLLLVLSGILLIYAVQFAFNARRFQVPPGDYLAFLEIAAADSFPESELRKLQAGWRDQHAVWANRARRAYNAGIVVLLAGVGIVLVPKAGPGHMPPLRVAAVTLALLGAAIEISWWLLSPRWRRRRSNMKQPRYPAT